MPTFIAEKSEQYKQSSRVATSLLEAVPGFISVGAQIRKWPQYFWRQLTTLAGTALDVTSRANDEEEPTDENNISEEELLDENETSYKEESMDEYESSNEEELMNDYETSDED